MRHKLLLIILFLSLPSLCFAQPSSRGGSYIERGGIQSVNDASTTTYPWQTTFSPDGGVADDGDGSATVNLDTALTSTFLKLDCSNDPLTADLDIQGDLELSGTGPDYTLAVTGGDTFGWHAETDLSYWKNNTDGIFYWLVDSSHNLNLLPYSPGSNVGINLGVGTPAYTLDVGGDIRGTGTLRTDTITVNTGASVSFSDNNITNVGDIALDSLSSDAGTSINVVNNNESTTLTDITQALDKAGLVIETEYTTNAYTPGLFWSTSNNNPTKPKAGIYLKETGSGSHMYFGTSATYSTGITNTAIAIDHIGNVGISDITPDATLDVEGSVYIGTTNKVLIQHAAGELGIVGFNGLQYNNIAIRAATGSGGGMYLNTAGNVGIGLTAPLAKLHIAQTDAANDEALYIDTEESTATQDVFVIETDATSADTVKFKIQASGVPYMLETTTPTAVTNYGAVYTKTDNNLYFQDGAGTEHTLLKGATGTQHAFFVPLEDPTGTVGNWDIIEINAAQAVHFTCQIPEDFESLTAATIVMIPDATETIQWDIFVSVAAAGEAYDNDDRSAADQQLAVTVSQLTEADISGQLTGLAAGDYVAIDFQSDTANLRICGFEFDWN